MNRLLNKVHRVMLWAFLLALSLPTAMALGDTWPRTLPVGEGLVTIYPLQVEELDGNTLRYRAALAWRPTADADPVFGAGWFESQVVIDQADRVVRHRDLNLVNTRFPEGTAELQSGFAAAVAEQSPDWNLDLSLDDLNAGLQTAAAERASLEKLNTAPPRIVYRDRPALLLTLDGKPVLRKIEGSPYQAVINTTYPLIYDGRRYYLNAASEVWYVADAATGPYRYEPGPPAEITAMVRPDDNAEAVETAAEPINAANAPEVVVATEPTELIVTDGPAVFVPLVDDLLVLENSDDDVFMHVASQQFYIVLSGRWYHSGSLNGPWSYRAARDLPAAFAEIPPDSAQADSRVYVAGTPEAEEAVQDAQVPEVQAVARGPAEVEAEYDGEPEFAPVDGTELNYAANSRDTVLQSNRRYYLVEDGVWYESATPNGPWEVATQRPVGVEAIAPSSPVYNAKYVYIYGSTPRVVYVGYTPGYLGNYVYYDTIVYGTGWYYRPWISPWYYYPRPSTWGFHVSYNYWDGWSFGLSWNWGWGWGPFYAGFYSGGYWHHSHHWHHRHRGYWRPRGHYRPRPVPYARHGYHRDRYGHSGYPRNRGGYPGGHRLHEDSRGRDRLAQSGNAQVRNAAFAGNAKVRRHGTDPVRASDLRLKARARDADAAAGRNLLVADRRGDVSPRLVRDKERTSAAAPVGGSHSKVRQHATTPVRSGNTQMSREAERRGRDRLAGQTRSGPVGSPAPRRPVAGSPNRFSQSGQRQVEQNRQRRSTAVSPASRGPAARRDQAQPARAQPALPRQAPPVARRDAPRQSQGPRNVAPSPSAGVAMRQQAPAPRAGPGNRANRSAAPAPQPRGGHQGAGRQSGGSHSGPRRNRKH